MPIIKKKYRAADKLYKGKFFYFSARTLRIEILTHKRRNVFSVLAWESSLIFLCN